MSSVIAAGTQQGDEGKERITDFLSENAEVVVRHQGDDNAGHITKFNGVAYKLHLISSGVFYKDKTSVIENGVVVNSKSLVKELAYLHRRGAGTSSLCIFDRARVILPYHIKLDQLQEDARDENKIGTTIKRIGPAYMDKATCAGIRIVGLLDGGIFEERLRLDLDDKNRQFVKMFDSEPLDFDDIFEEYYEYGQQIKQYITDTLVTLNDALDVGRRVLFERAQGVMLDIDQGTYPFVISPSPVASGVTIGNGVGSSETNKAVGVYKAYTPCVGDGPFPTELLDEIGEQIHKIGREYGTTTGRPHRIGWFDSVAMRHSKWVSGITSLSLNSISALSGLETVKICAAYELDDGLIYHYPASLKELNRCKPIYEELPGWSEDIIGRKALTKLPENARNYIRCISELVDVYIPTFSIGPDRTQTNILESIWARI